MKPLVKPTVRCEKKYIISQKDYMILSPLIRATLQKDRYADNKNEYYVRSLYFDTLDDKDYKEKQQALEKRQKIRLRIYDAEQRLVKLENKRKYGSFMIKHVAEISADDAKCMIKGEYGCLLSYHDHTLHSIYAELMAGKRVPAVIVDYIREAYVEENMDFRINFDKRIATTTEFDLFDPHLFTMPIQQDDYFILEAKYTNYIPAHIQSILSSFNLIETTYSKYVYSRLNI